MSRMNEIAYVCGLDVVETTSAMNGYPQQLRKAIIGMDDFTEAERIAKKYGLGITTLYRRDGWQLWVRNSNTTYEPLRITSENYGGSYAHYEGGDTRSFLEDEFKPFLSEFDSWDDLQKFIDQKRKVMNHIKMADASEWVITQDGEYYQTISKESMSWSHDTHNYVIALID